MTDFDFYVLITYLIVALIVFIVFIVLTILDARNGKDVKYSGSSILLFTLAWPYFLCLFAGAGVALVIEGIFNKFFSLFTRK